MELVNLKGNTWTIPGPVNIGVYVKGNDAVLIDSGNDSSAGRKVLRLIEGKNWNIKWIINTHFHADHIGGNAFIQKRTNCCIAASPKEAPFIDFPQMEPELLWSGTAPKMLCNKFLQAEQSTVTKIVTDGDKIEGFGLEIVDLPGHAHGQIGINTPDDILFIADSVIAEHILNKYGIPFVADYMHTILTFDKLEKMEADFFVPSHGNICSDIKSMVRVNRKCLESLKDEILDICAKTRSRDEIVAALALRHGITMNLPQYVLTHSTVSAITTPLIDSGELIPSYDSGLLELSRKA